MATSGDDMNERLVRVEDKVDGLSDRVDGLSDRVDGLSGRVDGLSDRVDALADKVDIRFEKVREDIQKLGEGYEQGLTAISRQISDMDRRWTEKWSTHDLAITDHGQRITALEQRRK